MYYNKQSNGNDTSSKKLIQKFFKQVKNLNMTITKKTNDYIDGFIEFSQNGKNYKFGIEIKDRRDQYWSSNFTDVICEQHKLNKFLFDKNHPNCAEHKGIVRLYVINIYKDNVFWIGDIEDHEPITRMANKTTEFGNREVVAKKLLSIKRKLGFKFEEQGNGEVIFSKI